MSSLSLGWDEKVGEQQQDRNTWATFVAHSLFTPGFLKLLTGGGGVAVGVSPNSAESSILRLPKEHQEEGRRRTNDISMK